MPRDSHRDDAIREELALIAHSLRGTTGIVRIISDTSRVDAQVQGILREAATRLSGLSKRCDRLAELLSQDGADSCVSVSAETSAGPTPT